MNLKEKKYFKILNKFITVYCYKPKAFIYTSSTNQTKKTYNHYPLGLSSTPHRYNPRGATHNTNPNLWHRATLLNTMVLVIHPQIRKFGIRKYRKKDI